MVGATFTNTVSSMIIHQGYNVLAKARGDSEMEPGSKGKMITVQTSESLNAEVSGQQVTMSEPYTSLKLHQ